MHQNLSAVVSEDKYRVLDILLEKNILKSKVPQESTKRLTFFKLIFLYLLLGNTIFKTFFITSQSSPDENLECEYYILNQPFAQYMLMKRLSVVPVNALRPTLETCPSKFRRLEN